eukprot:scaffold923_cov256-Pinguiococcus_pyrenoidosus.AAC.22
MSCAFSEREKDRCLIGIQEKVKHFKYTGLAASEAPLQCSWNLPSADRASSAPQALTGSWTRSTDQICRPSPGGKSRRPPQCSHGRWTSRRHSGRVSWPLMVDDVRGTRKAAWRSPRRRRLGSRRDSPVPADPASPARGPPPNPVRRPHARRTSARAERGRSPASGTIHAAAEES